MKKFKNNQNKIVKIRKIFAIITTITLILFTCVLPVFAADTGTGTGVENSFSAAENLMVTVVKFIGIGMGIFGVVEFAIAWQSHDGSGRLKGLTLLGSGIIIYFARDLLSIMGLI